MKYFTREQHDDSSTSGDRAAAVAAREAFNRRCELYRNQLKNLRPRLSKQAGKFFENVSLHDSTLLAMRVGDDIHRHFPRYRTNIVNNRRLAVELDVLNHEETRLYTLRHRRLRRATFDYPSPEPWYLRYSDLARNPIDDWIADELTSVDAHFLRHEVLFSSGTTLLIEFQQFSVKVDRVKGRLHLPYTL